MSTAIVKLADVGVGDPATDAQNALLAAINQLQQSLSAYASANPNDLLLGGIINQAKQLTAAAAQVGMAVGTLEGQLAQCQATTTPTTTPSTASPAATGVSPAAASFIAIGSALLGGVAGYGVRGRLRR
jgi:hypothetical protein